MIRGCDSSVIQGRDHAEPLCGYEFRWEHESRALNSYLRTNLNLEPRKRILPPQTPQGIAARPKWCTVAERGAFPGGVVNLDNWHSRTGDGEARNRRKQKLLIKVKE